MKVGGLVDRIEMAADLARGKKVLDIGGQHPMNHDPHHPFARAYRRIAENASEYRSFDRDAQDGVAYVGDLNTAGGREILYRALKDYQPDVVLCMEVLEHLNYPCEVMDRLSDWLIESCGTVFITIPNNGNWVLNALNWHQDHNVAFFKSIAQRFVGRSGLGRCHIEMFKGMQTYQWYWWIAYLIAFCQPFNWVFKIAAPPRQKA